VTVQVTVAVPVFNRREQMRRCLDAILALDHPSYEVLVLDNRSTDGTLEDCRDRAESAPVPMRVVSLEGAVGRLRNQAAELGRGDILAFTDSDCMPTPGWLDAPVRMLEADPGLGIVQGATRPEPGAERRPWDVTQDIPAWSGFYEACNVIVRRSALAATPGFDEEVFFGEDTAAGAAIRRAGWGVAFAPEAVVHHDVTHPGYGYWLRRGLKYGNLARTLRAYPELRDEVLWHRVFLRPRSLLTLGLAAGLLAGLRRPSALLLAAPYAVARAPRRRNVVVAGYRLARYALFDLSILAGTVRGSLRHRSPLL
jgi:GT2 family glycosyltransferase